MVYVAACIIVVTTALILLPVVIPLAIGLIFWGGPMLLISLGLFLVANEGVNNKGAGVGLVLLSTGLGVYGYYAYRSYAGRRKASAAKEAEKMHGATQWKYETEQERERRRSELPPDYEERKRQAEAIYKIRTEERARLRAQPQSNQEKSGGS